MQSSQLTFKQKAFAYIQLTRFDRPVGIELLLWPTLWSVMLAGMGQAQATGDVAGLPDLKIFVLYAIGAALMRAAGCAINDFADRKVDGSVWRTKGRPLADGRLTGKEAIGAFLLLSMLSCALLLFLPIEVFYWSFGAIALAFIYPFMKRYTYFPQVFLAAAFGWAIPMSYVAIQGSTDIWCWLLFIAYMCWTIAYDTQYAMADREDDLQIGVKSTAILFGRVFGKYEMWVISALQAFFLIVMGIVLYHYFSTTAVGILPVLGLAPVIFMFYYQNMMCAELISTKCFDAFLHNIWVGRYTFALVTISTLASYLFM